ncbi:MAG: DUF1570 domain-containing protein [Alphaproteobacteria bacterium]|nr:MAG: DUF1570 domain-containing protein [Alphaproteobacteria bacterium]
MAQELAQATMTRLHDLVGGTIPPPPYIVLHASAADLPRGGEDVVGVYQPPLQTMHLVCGKETTTDDFTTEVRHEATHHYLYAAFGLVPFWLNEGLATYMESGPLTEATAKDHLNPSRLRTFQALIRHGTAPQLSDILKNARSHLALSDTYAACWALIFALMHDDDAQRQARHRRMLRSLLALAASQPEGINAAFVEEITRDGESLEEWEQSWRRALWAWR